MIFVILVLLIIAIAVCLSCLCIVPQGNAWVIERLGKYHTIWYAGLHIRTPVLERIARKISLKEQVADFEPQSVITKDNVTMMVDSIVFFQIMDPKLLTYGVERPIAAIENLSATTLRNIIGELSLDDTLSGRDTINSQITQILDKATDKWGIKVTRVEVKDITPPKSIQDAMEKQMKAEREKRAIILTAEGEKESAILRADAVQEQRIREAQGEAEAIEAVANAKAKAIRLINEATPSEEYLKIRSFEAAEKMADGQSTKIIVPSDIQNLAKTVTEVKEIATK
mgnify:CR=1 FL=1